MAQIVPSFEQQAPGLSADTWSDVLKSQIGSSSRTQREAARTGLGDASTQSRFDNTGTRYAGWKESAYAPSDMTEVDDETKLLFGNRLGQYTSGGKTNFGYYGDADIYNPEEAGTYLGSQGWNLAKGPEDNDYIKSGLDLVSYGFGNKPKQAVYRTGHEDFTQKSGVDNYLKTLGYNDQGANLNIKHNLATLPGLTDNFFKLKDSVYGKLTPEEYIKGLGFDTRIGEDLGLTAANFDNLPGFKDSFLTLNDMVYGKDTAQDFLTGQGYKNIDDNFDLTYNKSGAMQPYEDTLAQLFGDTWARQTPGEYLDTSGYKNLGTRYDFTGTNTDKLAPLLEGSVKLDGAYYNKQDPLEFLTSLGLKNIGGKPDLSATNQANIADFANDMIGYNDQYFNDETILDYLTGKGFVDIGGAPNMGVNDQALMDRYNQDLVKSGDQYFNKQNELDYLLGNGYGLASNQNMLPEFQNLFGSNMGRADNQMVFKGDTDYSTARYGTEGLGTRDLSNGRYEILDAAGNVSGTGYRSLDDTLKAMTGVGSLEDYLRDNVTTSGRYSSWLNPMEQPGEDGQPVQPTSAKGDKGRQGLIDSATSYYNNYLANNQMTRHGAVGVSDLQKWDQLGDLLQGQTPSEQNKYLWRNLGGDPETEKIRGLDSLYGSQVITTPDGKFLGYKQDMTPGEVGDFGYKNPNQLGVEDLKGTSQSAAYMGRRLNDPDAWNRLTTGMGDGNVFINPENAAQLPGWDQYSSFNWQKPDNGIFGQNGLGKVLTPIAQALSFTPLAPYAQAYLAMSALKHNDPLGAAMNAYGSYTGFNPGSGLATPDFMKGMSPAVQAGLKSAAIGGLGTAIKGGDLGDILKSGATSGLGSYAGSSLGDMFSKGMGELVTGQGKDFTGPPDLSAVDMGAIKGAGSFGSSLGQGAIRSLASGNSNMSDVLKSAALSGVTSGANAGIGSGLKALGMSGDVAGTIARTSTGLGNAAYKQNQQEEQRKKQQAAALRKQQQRIPPRKV